MGKKKRALGPVFLNQPPESATAVAGTLLQLALVLLNGSLVVTDPTQIRKDAGFGDGALEAPQRGFNTFVLADCDLTHPFPEREQ